MPERLLAAEPAAAPGNHDVPRSIAIIMDGNGRWAETRGLPVAEGHRAGTRALRRTVEASIDLGVESLTVYAFSTENWTRPTDEVEALMEIFEETIERELPDLAAQGVKVRFIGRRDRAPAALQARMAAMEEETAANDRIAGTRPEDVDEESFAAALANPELLEPDLLIRTSGEQRISNFLLWQLAYSELVFVDCLWPDFEERHLHEALEEYSQRKRRFGGR
jgi:undecaprenyl diphosphate synthase